MLWNVDVGGLKAIKRDKKRTCVSILPVGLAAKESSFITKEALKTRELALTIKYLIYNGRKYRWLERN